MRRRRLIALVAVLAWALPGGRLLSGQEGAAAQQPVARLSHLAGSVQVQQEDATEAAADAALNMPVVQGERIVTGENGEAEIEFPDGSVLRLTPNSAATLERLTQSAGATEMQLADGLFYLELRSSDRASYTVYAADESLTPEENASFRVRVSEGQAEVAVLNGSLTVTRQNAYTAELTAGESLRSDPKNARRYLLADTIPGEAWDSWNERLSQAALDEQASRTAVRDAYAQDQGYGWSDLDANGNWYDVAGEGQVWQPAGLDAGFDPYGYGNWVYGPGGYTWASGYPWGWLPFRCGSWGFYNGFGWGWIPTSGCSSFGNGGGYGGGRGGVFPVRHPPSGWYPPRRPVDPVAGGARRRLHPTLPVRLRTDISVAGGKSPTAGPVRIAGVIARPIARVGQAYTPQGQSAVGATLLRDFPVNAGTREPNLGRVTVGHAVLPGRPAEWRRVAPATVAGGEPSRPAGRAGPSEGVAGYGGAAAYGNAGGYSGGNGYARSPGRVRAPANGRLARPTDPPPGANGAPPLNANGPAPLNANGPPPLNANGPAPLNANGPVPLNGGGAAGSGAGSVDGFGPALDANGFVIVGSRRASSTISGRSGREGGVQAVPLPGVSRPAVTGVAPVVPRVIAPAPRVAPIAPAPAPRVAPVGPSPAPVMRFAPAPVMRVAPAPAAVIHSTPAASAPAAPTMRTK